MVRLQRCGKPRGAGFKMIADQVGRDGIEPGLERALSALSMLAKHTQEGLLSQVLGKRPVRAYQPIQVAGQHLLIPFDQYGQSRHLTHYNGVEELLITPSLHARSFSLRCRSCLRIRYLNERACQKVGEKRASL